MNKLHGTNSITNTANFNVLYDFNALPVRGSSQNVNYFRTGNCKLIREQYTSYEVLFNFLPHLFISFLSIVFQVALPLYSCVKLNFPHRRPTKVYLLLKCIVNEMCAGNLRELCFCVHQCVKYFNFEKWEEKQVFFLGFFERLCYIKASTLQIIKSAPKGKAQ